jgi:hypothetical protein
VLQQRGGRQGCMALQQCNNGSQTSANGSGHRRPRGLEALGWRRPESIRWALLTEMPAAAAVTTWLLPTSRLDMWSAIC